MDREHSAMDQVEKGFGTMVGWFLIELQFSLLGVQHEAHGLPLADKFPPLFGQEVGLQEVGGFSSVTVLCRSWHVWYGWRNRLRLLKVLHTRGGSWERTLCTTLEGEGGGGGGVKGGEGRRGEGEGRTKERGGGEGRRGRERGGGEKGRRGQANRKYTKHQERTVAFVHLVQVRTSCSAPYSYPAPSNRSYHTLRSSVLTTSSGSVSLTPALMSSVL